MEYQHGGDIYTYQGMLDFSTNINPLGPSAAVLQAAHQAVEQMNCYPDPQCRALRQGLSAKLGVKEAELIFGNGAADLIFALVWARRPKKALLCAPSFGEYAQALKAVGCEIKYVYLQEREGFSLTEEYLSYLTADIDLIFLGSPDNPTGKQIDQQLLMKIAKRCRQKEIQMVLDACFHEFAAKQHHQRLMELLAIAPETVILRAFTKMYAMPGLRLGYGICRDQRLVAQMEQVRQPWSVSVVAQAAGLAALREAAWVSESRTFIIHERQWLEGQLRNLGICFYPSEANYMLLRSPYDLFAKMQQHQILIRDCSNYVGLEKGYYRIAVKTREENKKLLNALNKIYNGN